MRQGENKQMQEEQNQIEAALVVRRITLSIGSEAAEEIEAIRHWLEAMAADEGWQPGGELSAYGGRSVYLSLYEKGGTETEPLIGTLQIVLPENARMLPCQRVWPELPIGIPRNEAISETPLSVAHVLVLAVLPEWRRTGVYWQLCLALWRYCVEAGIRELWMEATPTMLRCYRLLGLPLVVRGELRTHWGEPCYPCSLSVREVAGAIAEKAVRSRRYRHLLTQAVHSKEITVLADGDIPH
jgi:ribosomal protein S18 acetylase RimI-like enzyme